MGFSISSPELQAFAKRKVDLGKLIWDAAGEAAHGSLLADLDAAAKAAGMSDETRSDIGLYLDRGEAVVGVLTGLSAREAYDLEWGTLVGAPKGWMRATLARNQKHYNEEFSAALARRIWGAL
jgi:hypothetical protein